MTQTLDQNKSKPQHIIPEHYKPYFLGSTRTRKDKRHLNRHKLLNYQNFKQVKYNV